MTNNTNPIHRTIRFAIICATILLMMTLARLDAPAPDMHGCAEDTPCWPCDNEPGGLCIDTHLANATQTCEDLGMRTVPSTDADYAGECY